MNASLAKANAGHKRGRESPAPVRVAPAKPRRLQPAIVLVLLLTGFVVLQSSLPLGTAIKIGADEDFAISKAFLSLKGYKLYSEVWNDQPPLHTFLLKLIFQHLSPSVLAARLLTVTASLALLSGLFLLVLRTSGLLAAAIATAILIASPGFLELSASAMVEIPGLAPVIVALCLLCVAPLSEGNSPPDQQRTIKRAAAQWAERWRLTEIVAGGVFAVALQIKLIGAMYLPLAALILWVRHRGSPGSIRRCAWSGAVFGLAAGLGFLALNYATGESLSAQFAQSRAAHFSAAKSYEYGSPADHAFDASVHLKNWDTTLPALIGIVLLCQRVRRDKMMLLPLAWLGLTIAVFTTYRPWWTYYYVHNSIPLCWCAAVGIAGLWHAARIHRRKLLCAVLVFYAISALSWMGARVYLQAADIRNAARTYSSLVLKELERYRPFTQFLFTTEAVYAFHADIPLPPKLATLSLKRFWTGSMTNSKLVEEMRVSRPGVLLLANDTRELPFQALLAEYRLVYQDARHRVYVLPAIIEHAEPW
jgi:hypothetical protein